MNTAGFPHSEIPGSMDICSSPRLIAAYHVFRRLPVPRHSPCALCSLTVPMFRKISSEIFQKHRIQKTAKRFSEFAFRFSICQRDLPLGKIVDFSSKDLTSLESHFAVHIQFSRCIRQLRCRLPFCCAKQHPNHRPKTLYFARPLARPHFV